MNGPRVDPDRLEVVTGAGVHQATSWEDAHERFLSAVENKEVVRVRLAVLTHSGSTSHSDLWVYDPRVEDDLVQTRGLVFKAEEGREEASP